MSLVVEGQALRNAVLDHIEHLEFLYQNSDKIFIQNLLDDFRGFRTRELDKDFDISILFSETKNIFHNQIRENSLSFRERHNILNILLDKWFSFHKRLKDKPEAIEIIKVIHQVTDWILAFDYFLISLSLINDDKTGDYYKDLARVVEGLELLSEVIEVFHIYFSRSELIQIYSGVNSILSDLPTRTIRSYFAEGRDKNMLTTHLKAICTLIISTLEKLGITEPPKFSWEAELKRYEQMDMDPIVIEDLTPEEEEAYERVMRTLGA